MTTLKPFAQTFAAMIVVERARDRIADRAHRFIDAFDQARWQILFRKVDRRFDPRERTQQTAAPGLDLLAEGAFHLPQRLASLRLGLGGDEIGETFDLGQVELAVVEGAAREGAGLGRLEALCHKAFSHRGDDRRAAMDMQLHHILAGEAGGAGEPERESIVDDGG